MKTTTSAFVVLFMSALIGCSEKQQENDTSDSTEVCFQEAPKKECLRFDDDTFLLCDSATCSTLAELTDLTEYLANSLPEGKKGALLGTAFLNVDDHSKGKRLGKNYKVVVATGMLAQSAHAECVIRVTEFLKNPGSGVDQRELEIYFKKPESSMDSWGVLRTKTGNANPEKVDPRMFEQWFDEMLRGIQIATNDTVDIQA